MRELEMPSAWAGLGQYSGNKVTFSLLYKDFCFTGTHIVDKNDEVWPIVVTITKLYLDDNTRDVLQIIDPAIVNWLEQQLEGCL